MGKERNRRDLRLWLIVALVAALIGYPLSSGPAAWAVGAEIIPERLFLDVYAPLIWVCGQSVATATLWYAWVLFWTGRE